MKSCIVEGKDAFACQLLADHVVTGKMFWFKMLNGKRRSIIRGRQKSQNNPFCLELSESLYFTDLNLFLAKGAYPELTWKKGYLTILVPKYRTENDNCIQVSFCPTAKKIDDN